MLLAVEAQAASLALSPVFGEHMVLQADQPIRIWGTGRGGESVKVSLGDAMSTVTASADGTWKLELPPRKATAESQTLLAESGEESIHLRDILIGEVWLCGGQSNMARELRLTKDNTAEAARATHPLIRFMTVGQQISREPAGTFAGTWTVCSPQTAPELSAVAYYFARDLQEALGVPVGLIVSAVGGTPAEAWTPREALKETAKLVPSVQATLHASETITEAEAERQRQFIKDWKRKRETVEDPAPGLAKGWQAETVAKEGWKPVQLPASWERVKPEAVDGSVWFRKVVNLPSPPETGLLALGVTRNRPRVWVNGKELKAAKGFEGGSRTVFTIGKDDLRAGDNSIAVRLVIAGGKGGIQNSDRPLGIYGKEVSENPLVDLTGEWLCQIEQPLPVESTPDPGPWDDKTTPGILWNGMIAPLVPISLSGVIWYQGEANVPRPAEYQTLFPLLITSWRKAWNAPDLPFLFVQLAGFQKPVAEPAESTWAQLRAAQESGLTLAKTAMVVAYDEGDPFDIHPRNKKPVGQRLALAAQSVVYGRTPGEKAISPRLKEIVTQSDGTLQLKFDPPAPLQTSDNKEPKGIAWAGPDRKFHWVAGRIEGSTVLVTIPPGQQAAFLRYAWANLPEANLTSAAGLPVAPFEKAIPAP